MFFSILTSSHCFHSPKTRGCDDILGLTADREHNSQEKWQMGNVEKRVIIRMNEKCGYHWWSSTSTRSSEKICGIRCTRWVSAGDRQHIYPQAPIPNWLKVFCVGIWDPLASTSRLCRHGYSADFHGRGQEGLTPSPEA